MMFDAIVEAGKMVTLRIGSMIHICCLTHVQVPSAYERGETVYSKWMKVRQNSETKEPKFVTLISFDSCFHIYRWNLV